MPTGPHTSSHPHRHNLKPSARLALPSTMATSALRLLFLTLCLLLAGTTQAAFAQPDGYNTPLAKNKQYLYYQ